MQLQYISAEKIKLDKIIRKIEKKAMMEIFGFDSLKDLSQKEGFGRQIRIGYICSRFLNVRYLRPTIIWERS